MPVWSVRGGRPLEGRAAVQGAKNAVLPIMAACLLGGGVTRLGSVDSRVLGATSATLTRFSLNALTKPAP